MHRLFAFALTFVLSLSLGLGAMAHATEGLMDAGHEADTMLAWHVDGDADHVPPDADSAVSHHHGGCHGHHVGAADDPGCLPESWAIAENPVSMMLARMVATKFMPEIQPPIF